MVSEALLSAYRTALYEIDGPMARITLRVGEPAPALDDLLEQAGLRAWAYLTAWNPRSRPLAIEENERRQAALERSLAMRGLRILRGRGRAPDGRWSEESVLALGLARADALALGRAWDQAGILVGVRGGAPELVLL